MTDVYPILIPEFIRLVREQRVAIQMDDVTHDGAIMIDENGNPNATQNAIGTFFPTLAHRGWLVKSDQVVPSRSPRRKRGTQRLWYITDKARRELGGEW